MKVKWWYVPLDLWLPVFLVCVIFLGIVCVSFLTKKRVSTYERIAEGRPGTASPAAEAEADDYDAEDCREVADAHYERGEYEEALKWYDRGLAREPEDVYLHVYKAEALYSLERLEEAVACYDRALELTPDDILPDYEKWRIIAILGNQPFPWNLHYHKADILAELGRLEEAIESCDQALKFLGDENIEKKHYVYKRKIKVLKELGTLQEALEGCDEALARDPADKNLYRYKVKILIELGRYEEAARTLTRASETGVENAPSYAVQIRAHLDHDEYEKAELYADVAVAFYPNDAGVLRMKGRTSTFLGKYDDALAYYDRALALDADDITAWWWKGYIFLYLGEPEAALECLERVFELYPDLTGIWEPKGTAYFMLDEYAQARAAFEKELALRARDEDILLHLYVVDRADGRSGVERLRPLLQSPKDTWKKDIGRFLAGETSTEDLLTKAGADKSLLCEAHCYIGYKCKFDGDAVAARRHFEEAVATEVRQPLEYILSQHELRRLGVAGE